ncbi:MAG: glutamine synthetase [Acidaminococcus sp.]|uniref:glutamine synthetase n=1 Tax=Acidaminococcus sp. TaxID=1872103 RepID=UPI0026E074F8|nr:glutamine synthetase [Acidaminococcus sp.]MDO5598065.1 glutamine synthetase [Acidaminococcus sp.]
MYEKDLLYVIKPSQLTPDTLQVLLAQHPEIKFVSFMGIDFAGNDTDEKVPISALLDNIDTMLYHHTAQTDGSSVVLPGVASLNDARVDMVADLSVNWFVDYNLEHVDPETGKLVGTLRVPCFLKHNGEFVDSRYLLKKTLEYVADETLKAMKAEGKVPGLAFAADDVEKITFTSATELEFWVKTPTENVSTEALSSSQIMQEQYWARTRGNVRTALEQAVAVLGYYGLEPEMGHKEVGGVRGQLDANGNMTHVNEQLEIDWKYSNGLQAADNEILVRTVVKEIFRANGLEVSFLAKPIVGVAGSGEHTHVGMGCITKDGKFYNLFSPADMEKDFLSAVGYGALMGILKNYEVLNPIVSCTTDAFKRLKPGFEAPICIVTSLGKAPDIPSRNRTILAGLIRDLDNPKATRFEMRAPNPFTNTYMALTGFYMAALDGIKAALGSGKSTDGLCAELSKKAGEEGFYLEKDREYRSENDVFEDYSDDERDAYFGKPPATVWENCKAFDAYPDKVAVLTQGDIIKPVYLKSFETGALIRWQTELLKHIIPDYRAKIVAMKPVASESSTAWDDGMWQRVQELRVLIAKDTDTSTSLFTQISKAFADGDFDKASDLQKTLDAKMEELEGLYNDYKNNIL